eukprot:3595074-Prymnesium_polylepis.1
MDPPVQDGASSNVATALPRSPEGTEIASDLEDNDTCSELSEDERDLFGVVPELLTVGALEHLVDLGLWSSASLIGSLIVSTPGAAAPVRALELYSAALLAEQQYARSAAVCELMLHRDEVRDEVRQTGSANTSSFHSTDGNAAAGPRRVQGRGSYRSAVQLRRAQCCVAMGDPASGMAGLEAVPEEERGAAASMALGNLYRRAGLDAAAVRCFRSVLESAPSALDAARQLLELKVATADELCRSCWMPKMMRLGARTRVQAAQAALE